MTQQEHIEEKQATHAHGQSKSETYKEKKQNTQHFLNINLDEQ